MPLQELMSANHRRTIRVGSRSSELALKQTNLVIDLLSKMHCELSFEIVTMETVGDKILDQELSKIGDKSLFTKELERALARSEVDMVVHSLKDVPTDLNTPGAGRELVLGCVCLRESVDDAVVMRAGLPCERLDDLPAGAVVGTSSVRRVAQLKRQYGEHLRFASVRGNLGTRLRKLDHCGDASVSAAGDQAPPQFSALILARAGLSRIGLDHRIAQVLSNEDSLYAVGQGALACECRADDLSTLKLLSSIHDDESGLTCIAERSLMRQLDGGCSTPIAVRSHLNKEGYLTLKAAVMSVDGSKQVADELSVLLPEEELGCFLEKIKNDAIDSDEDCPPRKRLKRATIPPHNIDLITDQVVQQSKDANSVFLGIRVAPICEIGRLRMAICQRLGAVLAQRLLAAGAKNILDEIVRTTGELETVARKSENKEII